MEFRYNPKAPEAGVVTYMAGGSAAIRVLVQKRHFLPGLMLGYTLIDVSAHLENEPAAGGVRKLFEGWCDRWVLPQRRPDGSAFLSGISSTDLYGARCGLLHQHRGESDMSMFKGAKVLGYYDTLDDAQLTALRIEELRAAGKHPVHCGDLLNAILQGLMGFSDSVFKRAYGEPEFRARAESLERAWREFDVSDADPPA